MESLLTGISASASTGYKPFVTLLLLAIAAKLNIIELAEYSQWMNSYIFIGIMIILATLEVLSTSIPTAGKIFELLEFPLALISGYLVITALTGDTNENKNIFKSLVNVGLGSGSAGVVKATSIATNSILDTLTAGVSTTVNSIKDTIKAFFATILAFIAPTIVLITIIISILISCLIVNKVLKMRKRNKSCQGQI